MTPWCQSLQNFTTNGQNNLTTYDTIGLTSYVQSDYLYTRSVWWAEGFTRDLHLSMNLSCKREVDRRLGNKHAVLSCLYDKQWTNTLQAYPK